MESASSSSLSSIHLALATLFGASVMEISAFYIHKRSVDQVLDRLLKLRHKSPPSPASAKRHFLISNDDDYYDDGAIDGGGNAWNDAADELSEPLDYYRVSSSLPNAGSSDQWLNENANDGAMALSGSLDKLTLIASGLPPVRTERDGEYQLHNDSGSKMRVGSVSRLVTPRSPGSYAFEGAEDSDEEGTELEPGEESHYTYESMITSAQHDTYASIQNSSVFSQAENAKSVHVQNIKVSTNEGGASVDSGTVKVDKSTAFIVGNDLIPSSTILPITTTVQDSLNIEDEEVRKMIRECLDLREKYVFRDSIAPWMKEPAADSSSSEIHNDPFHFVPVEASTHHFKMEDGVVHVYASEAGVVGALDGTLVHAVVPADKQTTYRGREKDVCYQNVLAICDFNMIFTFVLAGWEGVTHNSRELSEIIADPNRGFPIPPPDKYYLCDATYKHTRGFIAPYRSVRYWLGDFRCRCAMTKEEKFNHAHAKLRNVIERSYGVLKARFPILSKMTLFSLNIQRDIVIACFVIHNFIRKEGLSDEFFDKYDQPEIIFDQEGGENIDEEIDAQSYGSDADMEFMDNLREEIGDQLM